MATFCLYCNSPIEPKPKSQTGRHKKFCDRKCKFNYWKTTHRERYKELTTAKNIFYKKQNIERWKLQGLCRRCGKPRDKPEHKWCEKCLEYRRNYYLSARNKKIIQSQKDLDQNTGAVTT